MLIPPVTIECMCNHLSRRKCQVCVGCCSNSCSNQAQPALTPVWLVACLTTGTNFLCFVQACLICAVDTVCPGGLCAAHLLAWAAD